MGIFDTIKNAFGRGEAEADVTTAPSELLREAGLDPEGLSFRFDTASITVSGSIARESQRQKILDVLAGLPGIRSVQDDLVVAAPASNRPATPDQPRKGDDSVPASEGASSYTVESGDTLWKIAERVYGQGAKYEAIFEANRDLLDSPDHILPGQKLVIPPP